MSLIYLNRDLSETIFGFGLIIDYLRKNNKKYMIRKKEKKTVLERNPFLYYVTNVGFIDPIKEEDQEIRDTLTIR